MASNLLSIVFESLSHIFLTTFENEIFIVKKVLSNNFTNSDSKKFKTLNVGSSKILE